MKVKGYSGPQLLIVLLLTLATPRLRTAVAGVSRNSDKQVCDPLADYYLGMEDYPAAIRRHLIVIREHPDNALAHYHLGFAYGVMGKHKLELREYRRAVELGLSDWQLFLNLGVVYLERGRLLNATEVLRLATLLGPDQPATHFNLGLAYERRGMLNDAEREILLSLSLAPQGVDSRNTLGLIYAEQGRYRLAHQEWSELLKADPDYTPARENLAILERLQHEITKGARRVADFSHRH